MNKKMFAAISFLGLAVSSIGAVFAGKTITNQVNADDGFVTYKNADLGLLDYGDVLTYKGDGTNAYVIGAELSEKSELQLSYKNGDTTANHNYWVSVGGYAVYVSTSSTIRFLYLGSDYSRHAEVSGMILKDDEGTTLTSLMPNNRIYDDYVDVNIKFDLSITTCTVEFFVEYDGKTFYPYSSSTKITSHTFTNASSFSDRKFRIGSADGANANIITFKSQEPIPNEFTNNGQFEYSGSYSTLIPTSKCDSEGVPAGHVGSVLRASGATSDDISYSLSFNFTAGNIKISKLESVVFRFYAEATVTSTYPEFRLQNKSSNWAFNGTGDFAGAGGYSLKTVCNQWHDIVISPAQFVGDTTWSDFASSSDSSILGTISPQIRCKSGTTDKFYIDSITIYTNEDIDAFTNNGQFTYRLNSGAELYGAYVAQTNNVPSGYEGAVLKMGGNTNVAVNFDFAASMIPLSLVENIKFKVYVSGSPNGNYPEFRLQAPNYSDRRLDMWPYVNNGGAGGYSLIDNMNQWRELDVNYSTISGSKKWDNFSDQNDGTLLGQFNLYFRTNDTTNTLYIDSVSVELKANDGVGPVIDFNKDTLTIPVNSKPVLPTIAFDGQDNRNVEVTYVWDSMPAMDASGRITEQGTYNLTLKAEDYFHNVTQKSVTIVVGAADLEGPDINIPFSTITLPAGTIFNLDVSGYITDEYEFTYTAVYSSGTMDELNRLLAGDHTLTITAEDYSGNISQKIITIYVVDDYVIDGDVEDEQKVAEDYMAVESFCVTYLKKGTISTTNGSNTGACLSYYQDAKEAYNNLTDDQKNIFLNAEEYSDMVLRLQAWAIANGEAFVGTMNAPLIQIFGDEYNTNIIALMATLATLMSMGLAGFVYYRKRRQ